MAGRFIKLYDKILKWEWYKNINTKVLFIHLLLKANYTDLYFEGNVIKRGQLVTSLPSLSAEIGLSIKQIRGSLEHLISTGEVASKSYPRYRVITIIHYDDYQSDGRQKGSQRAGEWAVKGQAEGQSKGSQRAASIEYIDNIENAEEIEYRKTATQFILPDLTHDLFDSFWETYPRKEGKEAARKAFSKLKPDEELLKKMLDAVNKHKESPQWKENGGRFIPYPATWLNGKRWEDEVQQSRPVQAQEAPKKVTAQCYEQRDYSNEDSDAISAFMRRTEGLWK